MSWNTSDRRLRLPPDWPIIRKRILKRDGYRCTAQMRDGSRCPETEGLEVNHTGSDDDHRDHMLETLCHWHHAKVTAAQSAAAYKANRAKIHSRFRLPQETHPAFRR